ncbi:MAG: hypothetical protein ACYC2I_14115 [Elusimicrobiales bacterium]
MAKRYCSTHGEYDDDYSNGCPDCQKLEERSQEAAERAENDNKELLEKLNEMSEQREAIARSSREATERASAEAAEAARDAAYLANNPGDYECPECRMISLKHLARRCPKCQSNISDSFWERIREQERLAAELAAEEKRLAAEKQKIEEENRQKWLASPEYALEVERKKIASEAALAREKLESEAAARRHKAEEGKRRRREILVVLRNGGILILVGIGLLHWFPSYVTSTLLSSASGHRGSIVYGIFGMVILFFVSLMPLTGLCVLICGFGVLLFGWWNK